MENNVEKNNMLKEFYIPTYIFIPESPVEHASQIPTCPVVVFINTKSGGQLGRELIVTYRKHLNHAQVDIVYFFADILVWYNIDLAFFTAVNEIMVLWLGLTM
jgi:hypothetical protein